MARRPLPLSIAARLSTRIWVTISVTRRRTRVALQSLALLPFRQLSALFARFANLQIAAAVVTHE